MKIQFYTPACGVCQDTFGATTFGFVGSEDPTVKAVCTLKKDVNGVFLSGTYDDCLARIPEGEFQAGIVLFGNSGGENTFIRSLREKLPIPLVGGGAAIHPETGETALLTGREQVALYLIADDRYTYEISCKNVHEDVLGEHTVTYSDPRVIELIDGEDAAAWLARKKTELGLSADDFEHLTLSDTNGINAHLSCKDGKICSGRDLQSKMLLRYVPEDRAFDRMQDFYDDPDAVVFGCAGLKGILPGAMDAAGMGLFMFGEVCTKDDVSEFGNLMLSKLRILPR